jgi:hypothetical protein
LVAISDPLLLLPRQAQRLRQTAHQFLGLASMRQLRLELEPEIRQQGQRAPQAAALQRLPALVAAFLCGPSPDEYWFYQAQSAAPT